MPISDSEYEQRTKDACKAFFDEIMYYAKTGKRLREYKPNVLRQTMPLDEEKQSATEKVSL